MKPREIALEVLKKVYFEKLFPNVILKKYQAEPQDMALATSIVYTTLQHDLFIEYQFEDLLQHKPHRTIFVILKMSVAQLLFMDKLPDYAVVFEAVEMAKKAKGEAAAKFTNAILNKVVQRGKLTLDPTTNKEASISVSLPEWLFAMLAKQTSFEEALAYGQFALSVSPTYIRYNPRKSFDKGDVLYPTVESISHLKDALEQGDLCVQDKGSQRVVELMDPKPNTRVLDCCCAPGTKTLYISDCMKDRGELIAIDIVESRNKLVQEAVKRWGSTNITLLCEDARFFDDSQGFDQILVDAPCSGLGVIRHKPDIKWKIKPEDFDQLQVIQKEILVNMARLVKVGGELIYSTCTINKKENQKQTENFLRTFDNYQLVLEHQTHPIEEDCDGFYIAKFKRTW